MQDQAKFQQVGQGLKQGLTQGLNSKLEIKDSIESKLSHLESLVTEIEETFGTLADNLHPVRNIRPTPVPMNPDSDIPLQSPIYMRLTTLTLRASEVISRINHLQSEIEL